MDSKLYKLNPEERAVLMLWIPYPFGQGMTYSEISEYLNLSKGKISKILNNFRIRFPEGWNNIMNIFKNAKKTAESLKYTISFESYLDIKDKF